MAAIARPGVCENRNRPMSKKLSTSAASVASGKVLAPVRVFVAASLQQLIAAARLPNSGICEIAVNASLAFIEGAKPRDEIESALVIQMACAHSAAMAVLSRLGEDRGGDRGVAVMASAAARLLTPSVYRQVIEISGPIV
jgi:hypothetical protein